MENSQSLTKQWTERIQSWRDSGVTQLSFCEKNDIKPHQFWYWKRKIEGPAKVETAQTVKNSAFIPVTITPKQPTSELTISLPNGLKLHGIDEHNIHLTQQLIGVLR